MDVAVLRQAVARAIGSTDAARVRSALAAAGVLAARDSAVPAASTAPELPELWPGPALLPWRDPTGWLAARTDPAPAPDLDIAPGNRLDNRWWAEATGFAEARLAVAADDDPVDVLRELQGADRVVAVSAALPAWAVVPAPRGPAWSWPLRLAIGPGWRTGPGDTLVDPHSWWDALTVPVPLSGRWAEASLALLGDVEPGSDLASRPVRARAVIVRGDPARPGDLAALADRARRHSATVIAVVDPGPLPDRWISELVAALSHDEPLDLALHSSARFLDLPAPLVLGAATVLERARLRTVIADATRRLGPVELAGGGGLEGTSDSEQPVAARRRLLAERLRELAGGAFISEAGDASRVAETLTEGRPDLRRIPDRYLLAGLGDDTGTAPSPVLPDRTYQLVVRIAADEAMAAAGAPAFPDVPADSAAGTELTVVVTDLGGPPGEIREAQQARLLLPRTGDSAPVTFPLRTGPAGSLLELRVAVLHGHRFVQTGLLRARVGSGTVEFRVEAVVHADVEELATSTPHDAALVLNHTAAGSAAVAALTPAGSFVRVSSDITGSVAGLTGPLQRLVSKPRGFTGFRSKAYQELLIELARRGRLLNTALFGHRPDQRSPQQQALAAATRISVLCADPDTVVPLEFLYDRPLKVSPGDKLTFCGGARAHLIAGDCPNARADTPTTIVCPVGFWAATKILERHVVAAPTDGSAPVLALAPAPDVERHAIPLGAVFAAAAARADHNDGQAWTTAAAGMTDVELVDSWVKLTDLAEDRRSTATPVDIVLLVTHVIRTQENDVELELGTGDAWSIVNDFEPMLQRDAARNPLMVVLGCGTAVADVPLFRPPGRMLDCGAPAVVASLVTVLGRHIVPVAVQLLAQLRRAAAAGGNGALLGDALLAARKQCLLDGHAAVMALAVFGDTDWLLGDTS